MVKLKQLTNKVYCLGLNNGQTLGLTFLRFAEHYESPEYKGKIFTLKEYKKWYIKYFQVPTFDYCSMYTAYNIPDYIFDIFIEGKFNPLTKNEQNLINQVKDIPKPFYIIGITKNNKTSLTQLYHETAHALYYLNKDYKKEVNKLLKKIPSKNIKDWHMDLHSHGYHPDMYNDEIQAYINDKVSTRISDINPKLIDKFHNCFEKYCSYNMLANQLQLWNN